MIGHLEPPTWDESLQVPLSWLCRAAAPRDPLVGISSALLGSQWVCGVVNLLGPEPVLILSQNSSGVAAGQLVVELHLLTLAGPFSGGP